MRLKKAIRKGKNKMTKNKLHEESELEQSFNTVEVFEKRWAGWFDETNSESSRRKIIIPFEEQWLYDSDFRIENNGHTHILDKAKRNCSLEYQGEQRNRVTDFSGWIFSLDHPIKNAHRQIESMNIGKIGEKHVQFAKRLRVSPVICDSNWSPLFIDDFTDSQEPLKCSTLLVNNAPIYGRPDYVYFNEKTRTALIVEVKTSSASNLPSDSWPNLRSQLWAYGNLDLFKEVAQEIILIGEIWMDMGGGRYGRRKTYRWDHSNINFRKENQELFECYQEYASY